MSRFKGLGEMPIPQLRQTTIDPATRSLWRGGTSRLCEGD